MSGRLTALALVIAATPSLVFAQAAAPDAPVAALNAGLQSLEKNSAQPFATRYAAMAPVIDQAFDLPQILKTIVGLRWAGIPVPQQQALLGVFRAFTICNYVANFDSDSGDVFRILTETRSVGADKVVETEIVPKSGDPTRIDYVMHQVAAGWRATDVLEQGTISQAAVQRSDFRSLLAGGDAGKLIDSLKAKVATLSGGSITP
jgi:phospholipid transport system substrate-binding protein